MEPSGPVSTTNIRDPITMLRITTEPTKAHTTPMDNYIKESMNEEVIQILESRDIKPTSNRILVLKTMFGFDWAFTLGDLESVLGSVDKSTISRTIHLFQAHQLIHSFDDGSGSVKYAVCNTDCDCKVDDLHAHFYCNYCKKAFCLNNIRIPHFALPPDVEIESVNLVIKGFCGKCSKFAT